MYIYICCFILCTVNKEREKKRGKRQPKNIFTALDLQVWNFTHEHTCYYTNEHTHYNENFILNLLFTDISDTNCMYTHLVPHNLAYHILTVTDVHLPSNAHTHPPMQRCTHTYAYTQCDKCAHSLLFVFHLLPSGFARSGRLLLSLKAQPTCNQQNATTRKHPKKK